MAQLFKSIKVSWTWDGDMEYLRGFNVAITPQGGDPKKDTLAFAYTGKGEFNHTLRNIPMDNAAPYEAWVQAVYPNDDSDWLSASGTISIDDDGATLVSGTANTASTYDQTGRWAQIHAVNTASPVKLAFHDGGDLPLSVAGSGSRSHFIMTATTTGTGTVTRAVAEFISDGTNWSLRVIEESDNTSNHPEFFLDGGGIPHIRLHSHTGMYAVRVVAEDARSAAPVVWNTVAGTPKTFRVVSQGNNSSAPIARGLYDHDGNRLAQARRSYCVSVYDRNTEKWLSHITFDVFGNSDSSTAMAAHLNSLNSSQVVVVHTFDEPRRYRLDNGLAAAMYRCGASATVYDKDFKYRAAYILIGVPGIGEGQGKEMYAGDVDDDPNAWVETTFTISDKGVDLPGGPVSRNVSNSYITDQQLLESPNSWTVLPASGADVTKDQLAGSGVNIVPPGYSNFEAYDHLEKPDVDNNGVLSGVEVYEGISYFGTKALRIMLPAGQTNGWCNLAPVGTYNIDITPNKKWILSAYVRNSAVNNAAVGLHLKTSGVSTTFYDTTCHATAGQWKRISTVVDLTSDNSTACHIRVDNDAPDSWLYIDGIMLEEQIGDLSTPSAYAKPHNWKEEAGKLATLDNVGSGDVTFNYAGSTGKGGNAIGLGSSDTRDTNQNPQYYYNRGMGTYDEFKQRATIGAPGSTTYGHLRSIVPWDNTSGGRVTQYFYSVEGTYKRISTSATVWGGWVTSFDNTNKPAWGSDLAGRPADNALLNNAVSINADGSLSGAGGGQVTTGGIGAETPSGAQGKADAARADAIDQASTGGNLVKQSVFTASMQRGGWSTGSVVSLDGEAGAPVLDGYTHALKLTTRDNYENGNIIPVTGGERLWFSAWVNTQNTTQDVNLGYRKVYNGAVQAHWPTIQHWDAGNGWTWRYGYLDVQPDTTGILPFLQIAPGGDYGSPYVQEVVISRNNPVADLTDYTDDRVSNTRTENSVSQLARVGGGTYSNDGSNQTGAIKIRLPQTWTNTMINFVVDVYDYIDGRSFSIRLGGYTYTSQNWFSTTAVVSGTREQVPVRFGHDGTKCCIWLGETNHVWQHPKVSIRDVQAGYQNFELSRWSDGWNISLVGAFGTVHRTHTETLTNASDTNKVSGVNASTVKDNAQTGKDLTLNNGTMIHSSSMNGDTVKNAVGWNDLPASGATVGADWNGNINGRPSDSALLNNQQQWDQVGGSGKPADNATVGAVWGTNLANQPTDSRIMNNIIHPEDWVLGTNGSQPGFGLNGTSAENQIVTGIGPKGDIIPLWQCGSDTASDSDGGWNCSTIKLDGKKLYRFAVYVKFEGTAVNNGRIYFGVGGAVNSLTGVLNGNAYFTLNFSSTYVSGNWYLLTGYVFPHNHTGTENIGGIYDVKTGKKTYTNTAYKWTHGNEHSTYHRAYYYYSTSATDKVFFALPRLDVVDGSEPSLESMLHREALLNSDQGWSDIADDDGKKPADLAGVNAPTIGIKINTENFTSPQDGECYIHGFDKHGNAADVDGFFFYNGTKHYIPRKAVDYWTIATSQVFRGYLLYDTAGNSFTVHSGATPVAACRLLNGQWSYDNNGSMVNFTPNSTTVVIGTISLDTPDHVKDAQVWGYAQSVGVVSEANATQGAVWGSGISGQPADGDLLNSKQTWGQLTGNDGKIGTGNINNVVETGGIPGTYIADLDVGKISGDKAAFVDANITALNVDKLTGNKANFVAANAGSITVGSANISNLAVTEGKIANLSVTTSKIKDLAIDTLKIKDQAVIVPVTGSTGVIAATYSYTTVLNLSVNMQDLSPSSRIVGIATVRVTLVAGGAEHSGSTASCSLYWGGKYYHTEKITGGYGDSVNKPIIVPMMFNTSAVTGNNTFSLQVRREGFGSESGVGVEVLSAVLLGAKR